MDMNIPLSKTRVITVTEEDGEKDKKETTSIKTRCLGWWVAQKHPFQRVTPSKTRTLYHTQMKPTFWSWAPSKKYFPSIFFLIWSPANSHPQLALLYLTTATNQRGCRLTCFLQYMKPNNHLIWNCCSCSITHSSKSTTLPFPQKWANRHPWLVSVAVSDGMPSLPPR